MMKRSIHFVFVASILFILLGCTEKKQITQNLTKTVIVSDKAPAAIGPYSQAIKIGNTLYCSGQIAIDPETGELVTETIEKETRQVLENIGAILQAADMDFVDVVKATVYMRSMDDYGKINEVYQEYFQKNPPARAAIQAAKLAKDVGVEISVIAVK